MARVYHEVSIGDEVRIEIRSGYPLQGEVVWVRDQHVGARFQTLIDVKELLSFQAESAAGYPPRLPRVAIDGPVRLRQDGRHFTVQLCDISPGGAQITIAGPLAATGDVSFLPRDLPPVHGVVRWARSGRAGIAFNESLGLGPLATLMRQQRADPTGSQTLRAVTAATQRGEDQARGQ